MRGMGGIKGGREIELELLGCWVYAVRRRVIQNWKVCG